ncbi:MAG: FAD-dependent oxidoreductase [Candidatus Thermoplasmatota archaeon]|nr:FAD-dependent oxidoreductase [Candidatus Thermoplasmatota archaeon]
MKNFEIIVIGGAFAGLTAAIYSGRQGFRTVVISKDIGGQGLLTTDIQNYPGFMSISGFELASKFQEQALQYGVEFVYDEVTAVSQNGDIFEVRTTQEEFSADSVILAFGKTPRDLGVPGEERFKGKGVSYCAICDGPLFRGKIVTVAGAGDHALQAALYLSTVASRVNLVIRSPRLLGDQDMVSSIKASENVTVTLGTKVTEILGDQYVDTIKTISSDGTESSIETSALFVEMGYIAKTEFIREFVELNKEGEVIIDSNCSTSREGVFAAGDVTNQPFKQAVISAGQGSVAALSSINYVNRKKGRTTVKSDWKFIPKPEGEKAPQ